MNICSVEGITDIEAENDVLQYLQDRKQYHYTAGTIAKKLNSGAESIREHLDALVAAGKVDTYVKGNNRFYCWPRPKPEIKEKTVLNFKPYKLSQAMCDQLARCAELYPDHLHLKPVQDSIP